MKKDWRNLSWKDLNSKEQMLFIVLCALAVWLIVMALFYKVWNIPDWVGYLWMISAAAALYRFRCVANARMEAEEDEENDEELNDE